MVIIPDENQINSNLKDKVIQRMGKTSKGFKMDLPQILLTDFFAKNEIDYLDLLPVFKKTGEKKHLYHSRDTHWNIDGNKLAAETIFEHIVDSGLLK